MSKVRLSGWRPGLEKVDLNGLLRERAGLSLSSAKSAVDEILEGLPVDLNFPTREAAEAFGSEARRLGISNVQID